MRLDKYMVSCGVASRRETAAAVRRGEITVNGIPVRSADVQIDESCDTVVFCGETLCYRPYVWLMMNKPQGVISATEDRDGQKTVLDLLPERFRRMGLFPCGRLDSDTTGLLLLTNVGQLAHLLLSPKRHVEKLYRYTSKRRISEEEVARAAQRLTLADGYECLPAVIVPDAEGCGGTVLLREGKYHQIKRMFGALDNRILTLRRVGFAGLTLPADLAEGAWRELAETEVEHLRQCVVVNIDKM